MTLYKATESKQKAPSGGSGSFPTPVGGENVLQEPSFKGGADEAHVWKGEERLTGKRSDNVRRTQPQLLMRAALFLDSGVGRQQTSGSQLGQCRTILSRGWGRVGEGVKDACV